MVLWTPGEISPKFWLAADALTGLSDGDDVSIWADQSGNGNSPEDTNIAPVYKTNVLNSKPVIRFSPTSCYQFDPTVDTSSTFTYFVVMARDVTSNMAVMAYGASNYQFLDYSEWYIGSIGVTITRPINTFQIFCGQLSASSADRWLDGAAQSSSAGTSAVNHYVFKYLGGYSSSGNFNGDIAEIVVFDSVLNTSDRQKVEGYLAYKWGLQSRLPSDHPYKSSPPGDVSEDAGYLKPTIMFSGWPVPERSSLRYGGFGRKAGLLLPKYSNFAG